MRKTLPPRGQRLGFLWGPYVRFGIAAIFSMFFGAETVHMYYKPLADLDLVVEEYRKEKFEEQAEEEAFAADERKKKAALLIMELKKRQTGLANGPKDLRKDIDADEQQNNCSKDSSISADEDAVVL